jgi:hypothetical protein
MIEPSAQATSFPAHLAERRSQLARRLTSRSTPTEAMHAVREALDELSTLDVSQRSARERQVAGRALRIVRDAAGFLLAVRAEAHWTHPPGAEPRRPGVPWRIVGLVAVQLVLGLALAVLLVGVLQRGAAGGDAGLTIAVLIVAGLVVLQTVTGYQLVTRRRTAPVAADGGPEIVLRVDGDGVISTLSQALSAVDQLERAAVAEVEAATDRQPGLADYPELLRSIQQVYAARLSDDPRRARDRAEGLRVSLEQYGIELHDAWTEREPPPADLFLTQRSLDPTSSTYRVILPAVTDSRGVILPGRIAVPARAIEAGSKRAERPDDSPEASR